MGPLIPLGMMAASSLSGWLNNRNKQKSTSTQTTAPTQLSPEYSALQAALLPSIMKRLSSTGLPGGYETGGISAINNTFDLASQRTGNDLTGRGLAQSPIAAAVTGRAENARAGEIGQFRAGLPLIERRLHNEDMDTAMGALQFGRSLAGDTTTRTGMTDMGQSAPGGALGSLGTMLGWLISQGAFQGAKGAGGLPGVAQGLGAGRFSF